MAGRDRFRIYAPLHAFKKGGEEHEMRIGGLVSTEELDQEDEKLIQRGLDFNPFLSRGWFNDNHSKKTTGVLGYPVAAKYVSKGEKMPDGERAKSNGWWAEGYLLDTEDGRKTWSLTRSLEGTPRSLGFSIEGKVKKRDDSNPNVVTKATVHAVAITHCPVNIGTRLHALSKALDGADDAFDEFDDEDEIDKALMAGHAINSGDITNAPGDGGALRGESFEGKVSDQHHEEQEMLEDDDTSEEIDKSEDFSLEAISEEAYLESWFDAASQVDSDPGELTRDEARVILKSEHPEFTDRKIETILDLATGA